MSDQIIGASIQIETGNSNEAVSSLNKETSSLKGNLKDVGATVKGTGKDISETGGHFSKLKEKIASLPGPLGSAGEGVSGLNKAFKILLANPLALVLAAIVAALTLVYKAFTSTAAGADKMEQIFAGVGAAIEVVFQRVVKVAGAIIKFFSGDWKGAINDGKAAVSGFGDQVASEFKKAANAAKELQDIEDAMRDLGVSRAKLNRDLAATKEIITDETASLGDKKKAIDAVRIAEGQQTEQEIANAQRKLKALKAKAGVDVSDEEADGIAAQEAKIYQLQEQSATNIRSLNKQSRTIEREARAKEKEDREKDIASQKEQLQKLAEFKNKLAKIQQENQLLTIKDAYEKEKLQLEQKIQDEKKANEQAFKDRRLTKAQYEQIDAALTIQANLQRNALTEKHNKEVADKEEAFQKELAAINTRIKLQGITDSHELERTQLQIGYEQKLQDAITRYKDDAAKLAQIKAAIDAEYKAEQDKLNEKQRIEDGKKKLEEDLKNQNKIIDNPTASLQAKQAALDAEQAMVQKAFDDKILSEEDYTSKVDELSNKRKIIAEAEAKHKQELTTMISNTLGNLSIIAGKQTTLGKAFAVAQTAIDTYSGAISAYKSMSGIPVVGPALGLVAAAAAIKNGVEAVKKITLVQVPGGGGGSANAPGLTMPAAPLAPTPASTKLDPDTIDSLKNPAQDGVNKAPLRAYVVGSDVQNDANRNARLERAATLGG